MLSLGVVFQQVETSCLQKGTLLYQYAPLCPSVESILTLIVMQGFFQRISKGHVYLLATMLFHD